jgi:hypothetical protein
MLDFVCGGMVMSAADLTTRLINARAAPAEIAIHSLNELLNELARDHAPPGLVVRGTMARRTQLMFCLMRLRNTLQRKAPPLEQNAHWDETLIACKEYEKGPD